MKRHCLQKVTGGYNLDVLVFANRYNYFGNGAIPG